MLPSPQSRRRCRRGHLAGAATRTPHGRDGQIGWTGLVAALCARVRTQIDTNKAESFHTTVT